MKISLLKNNIGQIPNVPKNPRLIKDERFEKLVQSIKDFPKMLELRPIVYVIHDEQNVIIGGNMRLKALQELGYKDIPDEWLKDATELTDEERKEFIIKDNVAFGNDDWDLIANEWDAEQLEGWGMELQGCEYLSEQEQNDLSDDLEINFRIEIILNDEKTQELLYNELISRNYECRLLTL